MPLIQLDEEDIWEASLLESVKDEPLASLTPSEKALLLSEDLEPQGSQVSTQHILIWPEEAPKPDDAVGLRVITTDHQDIQ